jgi:hypothetical protein
MARKLENRQSQLPESPFSPDVRIATALSLRVAQVIIALQAAFASEKPDISRNALTYQTA